MAYRRLNRGSLTGSQSDLVPMPPVGSAVEYRRTPDKPWEPAHVVSVALVYFMVKADNWKYQYRKLRADRLSEGLYWRRRT